MLLWCSYAHSLHRLWCSYYSNIVIVALLIIHWRAVWLLFCSAVVHSAEFFFCLLLVTRTQQIKYFLSKLELINVEYLLFYKQCSKLPFYPTWRQEEEPTAGNMKAGKIRPIAFLAFHVCTFGVATMLL